MLRARVSGDWLAERLRELSRGAVLDVGCGRGRYLPPRAFGIDIGLDALRLAASRRVCAADARRLPFRDAAFDTVYAIRMLNATPSVDDALAEIRRVLRPGGTALVYTRARAAPGDRLDADNGAARLARHFASVELARDPEHPRGALFIAR